ncbi:unnamed protein product [Owenia fusiformis]|uniref:BHLH domain-containing protein n=1 Tax=Owenia fusiformis TaxID=6347 RepID=A0A8S4Q8W4_OWEFU|nr:unnamed protein product [Owenia fusiformis]
MCATMAKDDIYINTESPGKIRTRKPECDSPETVFDSNDKTIHSGHFMMSYVHDADDEDDSPTENKGFNFKAATQETSNTYQFGPKNTNSISIDSSLTKLFECLTLAYSGKLTSPRWKTFKGLKLMLKDKIRLNNMIWREWHMQYIQFKKPVVSQFATPITDESHSKPEAVVLEGKYWKRRLDTVTCEYQKWREFFKLRIQREYQRNNEDVPTEVLLDRVAQQNVFHLIQSHNMQTDDMQLLMDDDYAMDLSDTLFSTLNQPFQFPNPKEMSCDTITEESKRQNYYHVRNLRSLEPKVFIDKRSSRGSGSHGNAPYRKAHFGNADIIQPGLVQLQPSLDDYMMDTFEPLHDMLMGKAVTSSQTNMLIDSLPPSLQNDLFGMSQQSVDAQVTPFIDSSNNLPAFSGQLEGTFGSLSNQILNEQILEQALLQAQVNSQLQTVNTAQLNSAVSPVSQQQQIQSSLLQSGQLGNQNVNQQLVQPMMQDNTVFNTAFNQTQDSTSQLSTNLLNGGENQINQLNSNRTLSMGLSTISDSFSQLVGNSATEAPSVRQRSLSGGSLPSLKVSNNRSQGVPSAAATLASAASTLSKDGDFAVPKGRPAGRSKLKAIAPQIKSGTPGAVNANTNTFLAQLLTKGTYSGAGPASFKATKSLSPSSPSNFTPIRPHPSASSPPSSVMSSLSNSVMSSLSNSVMSPVKSPVARIPSPASVTILSPMTEFQKKVISAAANQATRTPSTTTATQKTPPAQPSPSRKQADTSPDIEFIPSTSGGKKVIETYREQRHRSSEQKRRCNIKYGFEALQTLIPSLSQNPNVKVSKAAMLSKGAEYIRKLKSERQIMHDEAEVLRQEVESLNSAINTCQSQLPATGVPVTRQREDKMKEMFEEYVRNRTISNWKFWIFSTIIRPLFIQYNTMVSTASIDELCRTVLSWLDQHCSLVSLRPGVLQSLTTLSTTTSILSDPSNMPEQAAMAVQRKSR